MKQLYTNNNEKFITYNHYISKAKNKYCIIFLHGLMSDMEGKKAIALEKYCIQKDYSYIRFDNFGCGNASGIFHQETISTWTDGLNLVIDKLATDNILLIGSSMGAWVSLIGAIEHHMTVKGLICLAPAPDFTENLIWNKLTKEQQMTMQKEGILHISGENPNCSNAYPISYDLILDGRKNMILNHNAIKINIPVHLIHGMQDIDVPYHISMSIAKKITSNNVTIKLIKDADHRLSRAHDINIITNSIEEILYNNTASSSVQS